MNRLCHTSKQRRIWFWFQQLSWDIFTEASLWVSTFYHAKIPTITSGIALYTLWAIIISCDIYFSVCFSFCISMYVKRCDDFFFLLEQHTSKKYNHSLNCCVGHLEKLVFYRSCCKRVDFLGVVPLLSLL